MRRVLFGFGVCSLALVAGCAGDGSGSLSTVPLTFGSGEAGLVNGTAQMARFSNPANVEVAADGTVYVADFDNDAVRRIAPDGTVSTLVKQANFSRPFGLALSGGTLYVQTDANDLNERNGNTGTVWRVDVSTGVATVVARNLGRPRGLLALPDGRLAMSDYVHQVLSILDPSTGVESPLAGQEDQVGDDNGTGTAARFNAPYGMALMADGSILVADRDNNRLRRVTLTGTVSTYAGTGQTGSTNGPRATATFNRPQDVAIAGGVIFVADHDNHLIRRIVGDTVSLFAGSGQAGYHEGTGATAAFYGLEGLALRPNGSVLWVADGNNGDGQPYNRVRRFFL